MKKDIRFVEAERPKKMTLSIRLTVSKLRSAQSSSAILHITIQFRSIRVENSRTGDITKDVMCKPAVLKSHGEVIMSSS